MIGDSETLAAARARAQARAAGPAAPAAPAAPAGQGDSDALMLARARARSRSQPQAGGDQLTDPRGLVGLAEQQGGIASQYQDYDKLSKVGEEVGLLGDRAIEGATFMQRGAYSAARKTQKPNFGYTNPLTSLKTAFTGKATFDQMEQAAKQNPMFRPAWERLKEAKAESERNYNKLGADGLSTASAILKQQLGKEGDARGEAGRSTQATKEELQRRNIFDRNTSVTTGNPADDKIPEFRDTFDPKKAFEERAIPGIQRAPYTDDEIAQEGFRILTRQEALARERMPAVVNVGVEAAASALPMVASARLGAAAVRGLAKGAGAYAQGLGAGAAQTAVSQGLSIASGRQESFDPTAAAIDIGSMTLASRLGKAAGTAMAEKNAAATLRRFGDKAAIAQNLIDSGAAKTLAQVPLELQPAVRAIVAGGQAAASRANTVTEFGSDIIELIADQAVARAQGEDPGSLAQAIYSAVVQSIFGSALGGSNTATPDRTGIDQQTVDSVLDRITTPDPVDPRSKIIPEIGRAVGGLVERRQGEAATAARKEELIAGLARRAAGDRAEQLYNENESDAALARRALGDRAEAATVAAEAAARQASDARRAESITLADQSRQQRTIGAASQRVVQQNLQSPEMQARLAAIERAQGSPPTPGQIEMASRAVIGGQRDVLPRPPEMTKEAIAQRVIAMREDRSQKARQKAGFSPMERLRITQESVLRKVQQARDELAAAKTPISRARARQKATALARDTANTGIARAKAFKSKSVHAQAMLAGRDWITVDKFGAATRLTAQEALQLAKSIESGKAKVEAGGVAPGRRGRPAGLALRMKDGQTIRIYRADNSDAWAAAIESLKKASPQEISEAAADVGSAPTSDEEGQEVSKPPSSAVAAIDVLRARAYEHGRFEALRLLGSAKRAVEEGNHQVAVKMMNDAYMDAGLSYRELNEIVGKIEGKPAKRASGQKKKPMGGGDKPLLEQMYSGMNFNLLFQDAPDAATKRLRAQTAQDTAEETWERLVRRPLRVGIEKIATAFGAQPGGAKTFADLIDRGIFSVGDSLPADAGPVIRKARERVKNEVFEIWKARQTLNAALEKAGGNDQEVVDDITAALFLAAEAEGEGKGIPSSHKGFLAVQQGKLGGDTFDNLQALMRNYGRQALRLGNLMEEAKMWPYAVYKNADGEVIRQSRKQYEGTDHEGLTLVDGFKKFEDMGGYMAHVYSLASAANGYTGQGKLGGFSFSSLVGWQTPAIKERLSRRTRSLEEAVAGGLMLSHEPTAVAIAAEAEAVTRKVTADAFRELKFIRESDEMEDVGNDKDTADGIKRARAEIDTIKVALAKLPAYIAKLESGSKDRIAALTEQAWLRSELRNYEATLKSLEASLSMDGWAVLRGQEYGDFDSNLIEKDKEGHRLPQKTWYIRRDLLHSLKSGIDRNYMNRMYGALHAAAKSGLAGGGNPFRFVVDKITNTVVNYNLGYNQFTKEGRVEDKLASQHTWAAWKKQEINDELWQQYSFSLENERMSLSGPGDMLEMDEAQINRAKGDLVKAMQEHKLGEMFAAGAELSFFKINRMLDKLPGFGWLRQFYRHLTDQRDGYFIYRMARLYGPQGSGPMTHEEAMTEVKRAYDMKHMSLFAQVMAIPLSFLRYRVKVGQQLSSMWTREPTIYGQRLGIAAPLTKIITENPRSKAAMAALSARGAMAMAAKYAEWKIPLVMLTQSLLAVQDIDEEEWEKSLEGKLKAWPEPVKWMLKQVAIPMGRDSGGLIRALILDPLIPAISLFQYLQGRKDVGWGWQQLQKNVLIWPLLQAASSRDYMNRAMPTGFGPGSNMYPLLSTIIPLAIRAPIEQVMKAIEYESAADEIALEAVQFLSGFKIQSLPDFLRREVDRFRKEGLVTRVENVDEGYGFFQPAIPSDHPLYGNVTTILGLLKLTRASANFEKKLERAIESYDKGLIR